MNKRAICSIGYDRPEMLKQSMDYISMARNIEDHDWYVFLDNHKHNINTDFSEYEPVNIVRRQERYGLTRHILSAMKQLFEDGYEEVLIVEDDILISKDFLNFLDEAVNLRDENTFTICGLSNEKVSVLGGNNHVTFIDWYLPWGVLYCREDYEKLEPHINEEYFSSSRAYIHKNFDELCIKNNKAFYDKCMQHDMNPLQAGLINVFRASNNLKQIIPCQSRCQNIGYYGFNQRLKDSDGQDISLQETWKRAMHYTPTFEDDHDEWCPLEIVENKKMDKRVVIENTKKEKVMAVFGKSTYVCPSCGWKTEAPAGTRRSCFKCNTRLDEKAGVVNKGASAPAEEKPAETEAENVGEKQEETQAPVKKRRRKKK